MNWTELSQLIGLHVYWFQVSKVNYVLLNHTKTSLKILKFYFLSEDKLRHVVFFFFLAENHIWLQNLVFCKSYHQNFYVDWMAPFLALIINRATVYRMNRIHYFIHFFIYINTSTCKITSCFLVLWK